MSIEFEVSDVIPATPEEIYEAWLDSEEHSRMTGGQAKVSPNVGDTFEAWDGYIQGKNLELEYPRRILQEWRTTTNPVIKDQEEAILGANVWHTFTWVERTPTQSPSIETAPYWEYY